MMASLFDDADPPPPDCFKAGLGGLGGGEGGDGGGGLSCGGVGGDGLAGGRGGGCGGGGGGALYVDGCTTRTNVPFWAMGSVVLRPYTNVSILTSA